MSFLNRLFGYPISCRSEILTKVGEETWVSNSGEVITQVSDDVSISSRGTIYTRVGDSTVVGSDGSLFTSLGDSMSSDGSVRTGDVATGRGAIFNDGDGF